MIDNYDIQAAFRGTLLNIEGVPEDKAFENKNYEPSNGRPWLRETLLHGAERISANNEIEQVGVMQYDLFYPSGSGTKIPKETADTIKIAFKPGTVLNDLVRCEDATVTRGQNDPPWYGLIIRIGYTVFSDNT